MSSECSHSFFPTQLGFENSSVLGLNAFLCISLFAAVFAFCLAPGGLAWALSSKSRSANPGRAIPGPAGLPLLGLVSAFSGSSSLAHRALAKLARAFGAVPLMAFSVGVTRFVISSHPDSAKEILNSSAFADRPVKESAYGLLFHRAMGFAPFGEYWRNLRRISATQLFSPKRVASFGAFRGEIGDKMAEEIRGLMAENGAVEVRRVLHFGSLNNVMMSVFGKRYEFGEGSAEGSELEGLVKEGYELLGIFNWSDHFPGLGWLDLQGVRKRCKKLVSKVNVFVEKIVDEHKMKRTLRDGMEMAADDSSKDFVDVLLDLQEENALTDSDMIAVLWVRRRPPRCSKMLGI